MDENPKSLDDLPVEHATGFRRFLQILYEYKGALIGLILWFIFLFVRVNKDDPQSTEQSLTIGVTLLMIVWWLTETGKVAPMPQNDISVPIAITALIPIVLFPLEGILDTATVCAQYANNITFLLLGSFFMAVVCARASSCYLLPLLVRLRNCNGFRQWNGGIYICVLYTTY
jgi:uncharacterized membrane protein